MSRRCEVVNREVARDPKYGRSDISKFINILTISGKKAVAERILYRAFEKISTNKKDPVEVFVQALERVRPVVEVKTRRVGGASYQIPVEVRPARRSALAMRWLRDAAAKRSEKSMYLRLASELSEAAEGRGAAVKKKDEVHKMAEANRAFTHFRF